MKRKILLLATGTLLVFPLVGWGILAIFKKDPSQILFNSNSPYLLQIALGIGLGLLLGYLAQLVVSQPFLKETERKYARIIANMRLDQWSIIYISLCAGFGEELLFRGAIQPLLGIWPTAVLFIALHGYLNPKDWRISIYGAFMTIAIAALGYLANYAGIWSACLAHAAIDYVLFQYLIRYKSNYHFPHQL